jgi:DNA-directed RNA polymerase specialized sigma24 family protein
MPDDIDRYDQHPECDDPAYRGPEDEEQDDREQDGDEQPEGRRRRGRYRREDDRRLVDALAAAGFEPESAEWHELLNVLAEYGYPVLRRWLANAKIYEMARAQGPGVRGLSKIPPGLIVGGDDAHELAVMTVQTALRRFLRSLAEGDWDADGGAGLATFFIGRCLMVFPDVYQQWSRERTRWHAIMQNSHDIDVRHPTFAGSGNDPAVEVLDRIERTDSLAPLSPYERALLELSAAGYTTGEIAEMFTRAGVPRTPTAVNAKLNRLRKKLRRWRDDQ